MSKKFLFICAFAAIIPFAACNDNSTSSSQEAHFEADGWVLYNTSWEVAYKVWRGSSDDTLRVNAGCLSEHLNVKFLDSDSSIVNPPEDSDHSLSWTVADTTIFNIYQEEAGWGFHLKGIKKGTTSLILKVLHVDHSDVITPEIPIIVEEKLDPEDCPFQDDDEN